MALMADIVSQEGRKDERGMVQQFSALEHRDAYATIRGFIYQVDRTILAWLGLDEGTVLYCECGEDIDHVRQVLDGELGATVRDRLLEQVKHREAKPFSLRSPEIVEALANLLRVRDANRGLRIQYRFFTNARPSKETGVVFPRGLSGLQAWCHVREGRLSAPEVKATVEQIRVIIDGLASRDDERARHAKVVLGFLTSATDEVVLTQLVEAVDWSLGNEGPDDLRSMIIGKVRALKYAESDIEASQLLDKLFVYVFRRLGVKGEKRLDLGLLVQLVEAGTLAAVDRQLLENVRAIAQQTNECVRVMAEQVTEVREGQREIHQIALDIQQKFDGLWLAGGARGTELPEIVGARPDEPPIRPSVFAPRPRALSMMRDELASHSWLALVGSSGIGKTLLARLFWDSCPHLPRRWISLRGQQHVHGLHSHMDEQLLSWLLALTTREVIWDRSRWSELGLQQIALAIAARAGNRSLLVIDDLPNLLVDTLVAERMTALGVALRDVGAKLITTSQHRLPTGVHELLGTGVDELSVSPLDSQDIADLLRSAGAPVGQRTESICDLLLGLTKGHPALVSAAVRCLSKSGWRLDDKALNELITGAPMRERRRETRNVVRTLVGDTYARELLDRLSIVGAPFGLGIVATVAETPPAILSWREHLDDLVGPWIQILEDSRFEVSALLQDVGREYLQGELRHRIHSAIAHTYLSAGTIAADEAFIVCMHLLYAGDWSTLTGVLIQLMLSLRTVEQAQYVDWVVFFYGPGQEWPSDIPLSQRIAIRAMQTRILLLCGRHAETYEANLEYLISQATPEEARIVAFARFHTGPFLEEVPARLTALRAVQGVRALGKARDQIPELSPFPLEMMFWAAVPRLKDASEIEDLDEIIRDLGSGERETIFGTQPGPEMAVFLADACYSFEAEKDIANHDWDAVLRLLDRLERTGELPGAEALGIAARRAHAIVLADHLGQVDKALALLNSEPGATQGVLPFVSAFTKSCILLAKGRSDEAYDTFLITIPLPGAKGHTFLYYDALRRGLQAAGRAGHWDHARKWCLEAIRISRARRSVAASMYEYPELLGELAWIHWSTGDTKRACGAMCGVVRYLMSSTDTDTLPFRETFRKVGHVLGWLAGAACGHLPSRLLDGEEYATPIPGILLTSSPAIADLPVAVPNYFIWSQLGYFAVGVGCLRIARLALAKAAMAAAADGLVLHAALMDVERAPIEAFLGNFGTSLECVLTGSRGHALLKRLPREHALQSRDDPAQNWRTLSKSEQVSIENFHVFHALLIPVLARLIGDGADDATGTAAVEYLQSEITSRRSDVVDYLEWERLIGYAKLGFQRADGRESIRKLMAQLDADDRYGRIVLYLALARRNDTPIRDAAVLQAIILLYVEELGSCGRLPLEKMAGWIVRFWQQEVANRAFRLRSPALLRSELAPNLGSTSSASQAARVLLAAELAADAAFDATVRTKLRDMSKDS